MISKYHENTSTQNKLQAWKRIVKNWGNFQTKGSDLFFSTSFDTTVENLGSIRENKN